MKLSYTPAGSQGLYTVLADESDRVTTLELADPSWTREVQVEALVRAESVEPFDRGNVAVALPVVATITYATQQAALASIAAMAALFEGRHHLRLEHGTTTLYFPNACCQGYKPTLIGITVRHALQFITQQVTTDEP